MPKCSMCQKDLIKKTISRTIFTGRYSMDVQSYVCGDCFRGLIKNKIFYHYYDNYLIIITIEANLGFSEFVKVKVTKEKEFCEFTITRKLEGFTKQKFMKSVLKKKIKKSFSQQIVSNQYLLNIIYDFFISDLRVMIALTGF